MLSLWACSVAAPCSCEVTAAGYPPERRARRPVRALADPTRRALLQRLLQHGPDTATRLAADSPLTRQAVVKHLQALPPTGSSRPVP